LPRRAPGSRAPAFSPAARIAITERRAEHGETDEIVRAKAQAAFAAGLIPIICVGEQQAQRDAGEAEATVLGQLAGSVPDPLDEQDFVIAYEPVWAIGTGATPDSDDIEAMHGAIRRALIERYGERGEKVRILYGGSLEPSNAHRILATRNVNGGLVGRASLLSSDFFAIISVL
jgi:triosephosphate isomerase